MTNEKTSEDNDNKTLNYVKIWLSFIHLFIYFWSAWLSFIMHMLFSFRICNFNYDTKSMHIYNICYTRTLSMNFALNNLLH